MRFESSLAFDEARFRASLKSVIDLPDLFFQQTVTSTNTVLQECLANGASIGAVAIAARQSAGRGQWGRTWMSSVGGLYLSMAIAPNLEASRSARLTLASAWGIATRLRQHHIPVQLKWPNDLYLFDKKLGGILTETSVRQAIVHQAVVGVGINWANETPEYAIALRDKTVAMHPPIASLEDLAALVVNGIDDGQRSLQEYGLAQIVPDYRQWLFQPLPEGVTWVDL